VTVWDHQTPQNKHRFADGNDLVPCGVRVFTTRQPSALVTGGLGFIGHALSLRLLNLGWRVRIADRLSDYYDPAIKECRATRLVEAGAEVALIDAGELREQISDVDVVVHLAAQPGVGRSWGREFDTYVHDNVLATQRLLETMARSRVHRVVYASSSSIYGDSAAYPITESTPAQPISPYGVTKLAAEHLVRAYGQQHGIPTAILRLFTVYGPDQRPDMAFHRLLSAALHGETFTVNGSGDQVRDFTYVDDVVEALLLAATLDIGDSLTCNIAGGSSASLNDAIDLVGDIIGSDVVTTRGAAQAGDAKRTDADCSLAAEALGWRPSIDLRIGLERQIAWHETTASPSAPPPTRSARA
jgi:UDP-glucuronate 4-epimerase